MILIALGSNIDFCGQSPQTIVLNAIKTIEKNATILKVSRLYRSTAWPNPSDPAFINAAALLKTELKPAALLEMLHRVEEQFGRVRKNRNAPRTLDLDLLAYGNIICGRGGDIDNSLFRPLCLPHPEIENRDFVLRPLCDIAPDWRHPLSGLTVAEMLDKLDQIEAQPLLGG